MHHLDRSPHPGRHRGDGRNLLLDGLRIKNGESLGGLRSHANPVRVHAARLDHHHVFSQALDLTLHCLAGSLGERDDADDSADTDDDAEHGQDGAHLIAGQGAQRHANHFPEVH